MSMGSGFIACICVIALSLAFFLGFHLGQRCDQPQPVVVTAHPMAKQADGSLVLARQPGVLKAQQQMPAGDTVVDMVQLTVRPKPYIAPVQHVTAPGSPVPQSGVSAPALCSCQPVTVDMSLVKDKTGNEDVIASSPDGQIMSGISAPVMSSLIVPKHPWAIGLSHGVGGQSGQWGVSMDRDLGPLVLGGDVFAVNGNLTARVRALVRF